MASITTTKKNNILHLIPFALLGGTEKDCLHIIEAGKAYQHHVLVLGTDGPMVKQWQQSGATVNVLNILHLKNRIFIKELLHQIQTLEVPSGVMYWSTIKLPIVRYALRFLPCKLAVHVGNPASFSFITRIKFQAAHLLYPSNIPTALFCCSNYVKNSYQKDPYFSKFEQKVSLNPVPLLPNNPHKPKPLTTDSDVRIGMTARLDRIKDHETLIRGFSHLVKTFPYAQLWLMGDGEMRNQLEALCQALGIDKQVIFHGRVTDVYAYLQQLDLFVYSTTPAEGLGNVVTEAMANGLPCLLSDLPMMREIDVNQNAARFFEAGNDKMLAHETEQLILSMEERQTLSDCAFENVSQHFSAQEYWKKRKDYLESMKR